MRKKEIDHTTGKLNPSVQLRPHVYIVNHESSSLKKDQTYTKLPHAMEEVQG